jgi:hypothetical protein
MLQNLRKSGYNRLSRRQVLKILGVGIGGVAVGILGGCTSGLWGNLTNTNSSYRMTALSRKADQLAQAFAKLNMKLLGEAANEMKVILKAYRKREMAARTAISKTRKIAERVFAHYNSVGLTAALEANAYAALQAYPGLYPEVISYLRDADLTEDEIQKVRDLCQRARDELLPRASSLNLTQMMNDIVARLKMAESYQASSTMVPLDFWRWLRCGGSVLVTISAGIAAGLTCSACAAEPTKVSCLGCAGAAIGTLGAAALAAAECSGH